MRQLRYQGEPRAENKDGEGTWANERQSSMRPSKDSPSDSEELTVNLERINLDL